MTTSNDLTISRIIKAPRSTVWKAWKEPKHFEKWWTPAPVTTVSNKHEFFPGGAFEATMKQEDGTIVHEKEGCFLEVIENERIVFTDALQGGWRLNEQAFLTAIITLEDHPEGTLYTSTAMHKNREDCQKHADMGFMEGWGTALAQLARLAEELHNP